MNKYSEMIRYLIVGVGTTLVSLITYYVLTYTLFNVKSPIQLQIANVLSWIMSVTFAYIFNKSFVFQVKTNSTKQFISFYLSRIATLVLDMILMFVGVTILKLNDQLFKLFVQFIVIVLNYILGKFLVFHRSER